MHLAVLAVCHARHREGRGSRLSLVSGLALVHDVVLELYRVGGRHLRVRNFWGVLALHWLTVRGILKVPRCLAIHAEIDTAACPASKRVARLAFEADDVFEFEEGVLDAEGVAIRYVRQLVVVTFDFRACGQRRSVAGLRASGREALRLRRCTPVCGVAVLARVRHLVVELQLLRHLEVREILVLVALELHRGELDLHRDTAAHALAEDLAVLPREGLVSRLALASVGASGFLAEVDARAAFAAIVSSAVVLGASLALGTLHELVARAAGALVARVAIHALAVEATGVPVAIVDVDAVGGI